MERVREEAATAAALGPIRFPWRRAIARLCMVVLAVAVCATLLVLASVGVVQLASHAFASAAVQGPHTGLMERLPNGSETAMRLHLGWLMVGLLIAFVPFTLSRGLMRGRQRGLTFQRTRPTPIQQRWPFLLLRELELRDEAAQPLEPFLDILVRDGVGEANVLVRAERPRPEQRRRRPRAAAV